jgi:hypothetical protein
LIQIRLDAQHIIFSKLKEVETPNIPEDNKRDHSLDNKIYQVCVCGNGRLFLAPSYLTCSEDDKHVCR